jgi:thymidylate kinase
MRRGFLIAVSGIDGSGKTTQIDILETELSTLGTRVLRIWSRWRPISSLPLLALLLRRGYAQIHSTSSIGFVETHIPWRKGVASVWCFLTQLDNFMKTTIKLIIPLVLGYTIICDRYTLDLLVEGMADLHDPPTSRRLGYKILRLLPHPNIAFFIDVSPEVAFGRKPDLPSLEHFAERVGLYRELCRTLDEEVLDGRKSREEIRGKIWETVSGRMKSRRSR